MKRCYVLAALIGLFVGPLVTYASDQGVRDAVSEWTAGLTRRERATVERTQERTSVMREKIDSLADHPELEPHLRPAALQAQRDIERIKRLLEEILEEDDARKRGELPSTPRLEK